MYDFCVICIRKGDFYLGRPLHLDFLTQDQKEDVNKVIKYEFQRLRFKKLQHLGTWVQQ